MSVQQVFISNKYNQALIIWATIIVALSVFVYFYQHSIRVLFNYWNDYGTYSHGYLTVLLSVFLLYGCVKGNQFKYSGPSNISLVCLVIASLVWLVAYVSSINTIQMLCLPFIVFFIITYFIGIKNVPILLTPIFILLLTIPLWSSTLPALQDLAVYVTNGMLSFSKLDYRVDGNAIIFSKGIFKIEESCSGLRYLLVGVLLSIVYGFLNYKSVWSTLLLVITAIAIMLIGNFIRILTVIGLGVIKGMDYPLVQDHESLGWVLFALLLLPLFIAANFINPNLWLRRGVQKLGAQESYLNENKIEIGVSRWLVVFFVYLVVVSVAPLYANYLENNVVRVASLEPGFNELSTGWEGPKLLSSGWVPNYIYYTDHHGEQYAKNDKVVEMHAFLYTYQVPLGELINANNRLADKDKWRELDVSMHQVEMDKSSAVTAEVNKLTIESTKTQNCLRIWYWYEVNGAAYTKKIHVKLHEALMSFKGVSGSAITSISTHCDNDSDLILSDFLFSNYAEIKNLINW